MQTVEKGGGIISLSRKERMKIINEIKNIDIDYLDIPELDEEFLENAVIKYPKNKNLLKYDWMQILLNGLNLWERDIKLKLMLFWDTITRHIKKEMNPEINHASTYLGE